MNKGGCLTGRKKETPNGGCKIGKRNSRTPRSGAKMSKKDVSKLKLPSELRDKKKRTKKTTHKMPNGDIHTGKKHTSTSKLVSKAKKRGKAPMPPMAKAKGRATKKRASLITKAKSRGKAPMPPMAKAKGRASIYGNNSSMYGM